MSAISQFKKIQLKQNEKEPQWRWSKRPDVCIKTTYKPNKYNNVGILTGHNNIMVLDVDTKDGGLEAFNEYVKIFGNIDTFCVKTCRDGYHYYFNATSKNEKDDKNIKKKITNSTKYRGVGLDIRCGQSGYVVGPGSKVNGKVYTVEKDLPIIDIPSSLLYWVTEFKKGKKTATTESKNGKVYDVKNDYEYEMTDEQFQDIMDKLDEKFPDWVNNYSDWLIVTTVCKYHGKYDIWNKSRKPLYKCLQYVLIEYHNYELSSIQCK
jgi:hypothetical protein